MIPDKTARVALKDWQNGYMVFWQEDAAAAMPMPGMGEMVLNERQTLKAVGNKNAPLLRQANPDWWKKPYLNVFVYGDTRIRTEELSPDVSMWGTGSWWGWRDDEIYYTHAAGVMKVAAHSFAALQGTAFDYMRAELMKAQGIVIKSPQDLQLPQVVKIKTDFNYLLEQSAVFQKIKDAVCRDLDGKESTLGYTFSTGDTRTTQLSMNVIVPSFQDYLIGYFKYQVDADAEGILIDDTGGQDPAGLFDDYTVNLFATWLEKNVDKAKLTGYGIMSTAGFNYRTFLKGSGFTAEQINQIAGTNIAASEDYKKVPLMAEFYKFTEQEKQKALIRIVTEVKDYARQKGRTDFVVTGNAGELASSVAYMVPYFDFLTFEHDYLNNNDPFSWTPVVPLSKFSQAKGKSVMNQFLFNDVDVLNTLNPELRYQLVRQAIMESYAAKSATYYIRYSTNDPRTISPKAEDVFMGLEDRTDLKEVQKAFGFMKTHKTYFADFTSSIGKVGVFFDNDAAASEWSNSITGNHAGAAWRTSEQLYQAGVDFDVINYQQIDPSVYKHLLLGNVTIISDAQLKILSDAKDKGVKLIAIDTVPDKLRTLTGDTMSKEKAIELIKGQLSTMSLPDKVKSVTYTDGKGNYLMHLFNYDYDADGFKEKKDIAIKPIFPAGNYQVSYASMESPELKQLNGANVVVPSLKTYGMLVFRKQ